MSNNRIIFQNWIVDIGRDPEIMDVQNIGFDEPAEDIISRVSLALENLSSDEQEFIIQFYYMGKSYREISEQTGRVVYKLEALHKRALKKLKNQLKDFVHKRYKINNCKKTNCPLCSSEHLQKINEIIFNKNPKDTWRPIIKILKDRFGIKIRSPQTLIGHLKYHFQKKD